MVAVTAQAAILRERVAMVKAPGERAGQPYHAVESMELAEARAFLDRTERGAVEMAAESVKAAVARLAADGYRVTRAAVLMGSGKPLPELAKILAAHPLIHTAEGVFYRNVLRAACERCGLGVAGVKEKELPAALVARASAMGKALGPPWTMDHKLAAAAALQSV
jgi:hypothetical protein